MYVFPTGKSYNTIDIRAGKILLATHILYSRTVDAIYNNPVMYPQYI